MHCWVWCQRLRETGSGSDRQYQSGGEESHRRPDCPDWTHRIFAGHIDILRGGRVYLKRSHPHRSGKYLYPSALYRDLRDPIGWTHIRHTNEVTVKETFENPDQSSWFCMQKAGFLRLQEWHPNLSEQMLQTAVRRSCFSDRTTCNWPWSSIWNLQACSIGDWRLCYEILRWKSMPEAQSAVRPNWWCKEGAVLHPSISCRKKRP